MKMTMRRRSASHLLPFLAVAMTTATGTYVRSTTQSNSRAHRALNYFKDSVVDGLETEYNEYAQSWRYLGLYVDCQKGGQQQQKRHLAEDGGQKEQCGRYLLWAAYVDVDYAGGGLTEYKIFDTSSNKYDATACKLGDTRRCVRMDCHSSGTSYKPLSYFRQDDPLEFIQLLAKYQGSCSWDEDQYTAVTTATDNNGWLPNGCTEAAGVDNYDDNLYYDFKPLSDGGIAIGVYTDDQCQTEHNGQVDLDAMIAAKYGQDVDVSTQLQLINKALDTFKVCQPCRTYDLGAADESAAADEDGDEQEQDANDNNNNNEDPNHSQFVCNDAAGNAGINMCEAIAKNSQIEAASPMDVYRASSTGTLQRTFGTTDARLSWWENWGFFLSSLMTFVGGLLCFCCVAVKRKRVDFSGGGNREPLVGRA